MLYSFPLQAQVSENVKTMSQGAKNALELEIPGVNAGLVADVWKDFMKDHYGSKPKWDRRNKEWLSDDAKVAAIGQGNTVDVYASADERGNSVLFSAWFDLGGAYLDSREHAERYTEAEKMLMRFALEVAHANTRNELDNEQDKLKKLQRELARLQSLNERYHKDIERAKEAIRQAEESIVENVKLQEDTAAQIAGQERTVESVQNRLNDL